MSDWLERHTSQAPETLRSRVAWYALQSCGPSLPEVLASAGHAALQAVLSGAGDRSAALNLLAADALVTLALLAQAETSPSRLEEFATSILQISRAAA